MWQQDKPHPNSSDNQLRYRHCRHPFTAYTYLHVTLHTFPAASRSRTHRMDLAKIAIFSSSFCHRAVNSSSQLLTRPSSTQRTMQSLPCYVNLRYRNLAHSPLSFVRHRFAFFDEPSYGSLARNHNPIQCVLHNLFSHRIRLFHIRNSRPMLYLLFSHGQFFSLPARLQRQDTPG